MKKLSLLLLLLSFTMFAQELKSGAGIKLHMNMAGTYGDDVTEDYYETRNAVGVTGFVAFQFGNHFSLQPELSYMSRGFTYEYGSSDYTAEFDYFQILFLMRFTIPTNSPVTPVFFFGPSGSLNISAKLDDNDYDDIRVYDAGPVFGAGIDVNVGPGSIIAEGRYYMGLLKLIDRTDYSKNPDSFNKAIELGIGYKFNI